MIRGGAYKPRTSPYDFQGLGLEGLQILKRVSQEYGLGVITEIVTPADLDHALDYIDVIQIGASVLILSIFLETGRTMNIVIINSLRAAGDAKFPVAMGALSMVMMSLPLGYFLVFVLDLGLPGIWLAITADEWTRAVIMYFRWKSRKWERFAIVSPTEKRREI